MTLKKIDYSKLVVYKIVCNDLRVTDLYVGSTTNIEQRKKPQLCCIAHLHPIRSDRGQPSPTCLHSLKA